MTHIRRIDAKPDGCGPRLLIVGAEPGLAPCDGSASSDSVMRASFRALDRDLLARLQPDIVVTPLVGDGFDVIDVARRLKELAFVGLLRAVARHLPNPRMVRREVAAVAFGLDFDIHVVGEDRAPYSA